MQVLPEAFDDFVNLRPWKEAADILAKDESWSQLYDLDQLARNEVKVSAVTYAFPLVCAPRHEVLKVALLNVQIL